MKFAFEKLIALTGAPRSTGNRTQRMEHWYWLGAVTMGLIVLGLAERAPRCKLGRSKACVNGAPRY
jgi:hypothetical protein